MNNSSDDQRDDRATITNPDFSATRPLEPRPSIQVPSRLGPYRAIQELGRGTTAIVVEAHDQRLNRHVALKVFFPGQGRVHAVRREREARALARISHPAVVKLLEAGQFEGHSFIAMELIKGESLRVWHARPKPWPVVLDAYIQAGHGLAAIHRAGLVHRDFKPDNCLIDTRRNVHVVDLGLVAEPPHHDDDPPHDHTLRTSRPAPADPFRERVTRLDSIVGTRAYMSPRQRRGEVWDERADQYSYCASVWEALHGEQQTLPVRSLVTSPAYPRALLLALSRGLSAEPRSRWPSMEALLKELVRCRRTGARSEIV